MIIFGKNIVNYYQTWLRSLEYEPYIYDPVLQSINWVNLLTNAIKKMKPLVGDDNEETFIFVETYWEQLRSWEFILNSLSIAMALNFTLNKKDSWQNIIQSLKFWVDNLTSHPVTRDLVYSGTDYFYDMTQFFSSNHQLPDPKKLAKTVIEYEL
ncbi:MAG: hypothetical protein HQK76_19805 [Desulfobacterales bacterium]|nr:hypothetical protein [Desulfobacterales bacterium]